MQSKPRKPFTPLASTPAANARKTPAPLYMQKSRVTQSGPNWPGDP